MSAGTGERGMLARMVAACLSGYGFSVQVSAPDVTSLTVAGLTGMHCTIAVDDNGRVRLELWPDALRHADPALMARQVMTVLDEHRKDWVPDTGEFVPDAPLTGPMGRLLQAAGLSVCLTVLEDIGNFDVYPKITATNPGMPGRGKVSIDDDAMLVWECQHKIAIRTAGQIAEQIADTAVRVIRAGTAGDSARTPAHAR